MVAMKLLSKKVTRSNRGQFFSTTVERIVFSKRTSAVLYFSFLFPWLFLFV